MSTPAAPAEPSAATASTPTSEPIDSGLSFGDSLDSFFNDQEKAISDALEVTPDPTAPVAADPAVPAADPAAPAEPAADPAAPADPLEEVDNLKDWTPEAARRFKEIKAEAKLLKTRASTLEQELSQREARLRELEAIANDPRVQDITSRAEEYEQAMMLRNLEESHTYKQLVAEPLSRLVTSLDEIADRYSVNPDALIDAVSLDDEAAQEEQLGELLVNATDRDKFRVYKIIEDLKPVLEQRRVLQENAQEALREVEELERQRESIALAERAELRARAAKEVAKRIETKLPFITTFDGVDLNALAEETSKTDLSKLDPALGAYHAMAGRLLPKMATAYLTARREIENLTEKLAEFDGTGSPLLSGAPAGSVRSRSSSDVGFADAVNAAFGNAGL